MKKLPEKEQEAIMRLSMCAMRECRICEFNKRKRVMASIPDSCVKIICERVQALVEAVSEDVRCKHMDKNGFCLITSDNETKNHCVEGPCPFWEEVQE